MTDESDPPSVVAFPQPPTSPPRDAMSERGARPVTPPQRQPEPDPPERIGLFTADITLRDYLTDIIGGDYTRLDWSVGQALRLIDPGEKAPQLLRYAARMHFRKIAGEIAAGNEKPTWRSGTSTAAVTYDRKSQTIPDLPTPPAKARLQLDLIEAGVCNLCGKIHDEPGLFSLIWTDPVLGVEIRAQFGSSCISEAIFKEIYRRERSASLENWVRAQAKRTGRKVKRNDDA